MDLAGFNGKFADLLKVKMKRILMLAMILACIMIPLASFAKTVIADNDLDAVTAQTGVSIDFTGLKISNLVFSTVSWGDNDGIANSTYTSGYTNAGYMGANAITIASTGNVVDLTGVMNIDVGTSGTQTRVRIVLPAITIGGAGTNITASVKLASDKILSTNAGTLATINIKGFQTFVDGTVTIFAH
jgi:hypothetical protein